MINVVIGVTFANHNFGVGVEFGLAVGLAVIGIVPVTIFFIVSTVSLT